MRAGISIVQILYTGLGNFQHHYCRTGHRYGQFNRSCQYFRLLILRRDIRDLSGSFLSEKIGSNAVFYAAVLGELIVIACFLLDKYEIIGLGFLWLNVVGAVAVVLLSLILHFFGLKRPLGAES